MAFIEAENLRFRYSSDQGYALDGVSLAIEPGEYAAVLGANGSGKSTLVRLFNGLLRPDSGSISVKGIDPSTPSGAKASRRLVSMVFQSPNDQIVGSAVETDIAFGPENLGLPQREIAKRVEDCLARLSLEQDRRRAVHLLSPGKQQLLALADALAMAAECLVLDEANSMVAPESRNAILARLDDLHAAGKTIVNVTHCMEEAARAERVIVLAKGRVVFDGAPDSLFGHPECRSWGLDLPQDLLMRTLLAPFWALNASEALPPARRPAPEDFAKAISSRLAYGEGPVPGRKETHRERQCALSFENVSFGYPLPNGEGVQALKGVSFKAYRGEITAVVGPSGAGKSSAIQLANALLLPDSGRVICLGMDTASKRLDPAALRRRAGLCLQRADTALFEDFAADDVAYGPRFCGLRGSALRKRVADAMDSVGLDYSLFRDRHPRSLSGGERRRLAMAGILALDPELYLLDEPTSSTDPHARAHTLSLIQSLKARGRSVVFTTHDMEEVAIADRVLVFREGRLEFDGSPEKLFYHRNPEAWGLDRPFAAKVAGLLPAGLRSALGQPLNAEEFARRLMSVAGLKLESAPSHRVAAHPLSASPAMALPAPAGNAQRKKSKNPFDLRSRITLGQYIDAESPLHALTPRMKFLGLFALSLPAFVSLNPWAPLCCVALALVLSRAARIRLSHFLRAFPPVIPVVFLYLALQFLLGGVQGDVLLRAGPFALTRTELSGIVLIFLKMAALMLVFSLFSAITPVSQIVHGVEDVLAPLRRIGVRVSDAALLTGITFRFVPILAEEAETILRAQASRGSPGYSGGLLKRAKTAASIIVPLIVRALSRAEVLAQAMEARCYPGDSPTRYATYPHHRHRLILFVSCVALGAALFSLAAFVR